jgi:UDP-3-O-[3-hydroxymyristoyl] glucosamine N-acyltransferase
VLVSHEIDAAPARVTLIRVGDPYQAFIRVYQEYVAPAPPALEGVHPQAAVVPSARIADDAAVDALAYVGAEAVIDRRARIHAGACVGPGARIGADTVLHPHAVVREGCTIGARCVLHSGAVIGGEGFGFPRIDGVPQRIPQLGTAVLEDDVEVGANSCIDRATFGETRVGEGSKIDNLVQIGHNVRIGKHCILCGNVGVAGSTTLGDRVTVGAGAGIAGHLHIGDDAIIGGWSGVTKSLPAGAVVSGFPAQDHDKERRLVAGQRRLPELLRTLRTLQQRLDTLESRFHGETANDSD